MLRFTISNIEKINFKFISKIDLEKVSKISK